MPILNFQQSGTGEQLILIHGLLGSLDNLNMVARGLATDYCITNIDVRNHGYSFHDNDMSYESMTQDIIDTLDHLSIESAHILGHSMGGKIAMQTALTFPQRVNKLVVADISPVEYPPHHQNIIKGLLSLKLKSYENRKEADLALAEYVPETGVRQFLLRNLVKNDNELTFKSNIGFIAQCYSQIMKSCRVDRSFTNPTLFIKGGNSDYINPSHQAIIKQLFPLSKAKIIQGAGHWLHAEKTASFNKIVKDFLL